MNLRSMAVNLFLRRFKVPRDLVRFAFRRYGLRTADGCCNCSATWPT